MAAIDGHSSFSQLSHLHLSKGFEFIIIELTTYLSVLIFVFVAFLSDELFFVDGGIIFRKVAMISVIIMFCVMASIYLFICSYEISLNEDRITYRKKVLWFGSPFKNVDFNHVESAQVNIWGLLVIKLSNGEVLRISKLHRVNGEMQNLGKSSPRLILETYILPRLAIQ